MPKAAPEINGLAGSVGFALAIARKAGMQCWRWPPSGEETPVTPSCVLKRVVFRGAREKVWQSETRGCDLRPAVFGFVLAMVVSCCGYSTSIKAKSSARLSVSRSVSSSSDKSASIQASGAASAAAAVSGAEAPAD